MNCEEANVLMHALLDGELDAGHARAVEEHIAGCKACAVAMRDFRAMREAITSVPLGFTAPSSLRVAVESKLPAPRQGLLRRELLAGFGIGSVATALAASGVFMLVFVIRLSPVWSELKKRGGCGRPAAARSQPPPPPICRFSICSFSSGTGLSGC